MIGVQGEYFVLILKLQAFITKMLQEIKFHNPNKAINIMNEYDYNSIVDKKNLYTFFFETKEIIRLSTWNYAVRYILYEHASTAMLNTQNIGVLMSLQRPTVIKQTKINEGYLFSTDVLEDIINIDDPLTRGNEDTTIIKDIQMDIINDLTSIIGEENSKKT